METLFLLKATACAVSIFLAVGIYYFVQEALPALLKSTIEMED